MRLNGVDVTGKSPQARAKLGFARTFQRMELFNELTVREHLIVARRVREGRQSLLGFFRRLERVGEWLSPDEAAAVDDILDLVGLGPVAERPAESLPLGTGRLVEVADALASEPSVMLLDEPSSGLDTDETDQLSEALQRVHQERGTAFVLVEHNVEFVTNLSDTVTVLDFGRGPVGGPTRRDHAQPRGPGRVPRCSGRQRARGGVMSTVAESTDTRVGEAAPLLRVKDLEVAYGVARALFGVTFDVPKGSVTTVLGANGAGKSSLAAAIGGVVKPRSGVIEFDGVDITGPSPRTRLPSSASRTSPRAATSSPTSPCTTTSGPSFGSPCPRAERKGRLVRPRNRDVPDPGPAPGTRRRARSPVASNRCSRSHGCWPSRRSS